MDLSLSHCHITVTDPDASLAFYRDALGLELRNEVNQGGFRWLTLTPPSQPDIEIVLSEARAGRPPADGEALEVLVTKGSLMGAIFRTADLDSTFEKIRASGAEVMQEPTDQPWGVRDCAFRDPSGNMIRINEAR
jgi:catechol 2,3-dioxygenase-like lactoylglutathione lyase family enzyme